MYFIDILQGSVETHLRCGGIYNKHVSANCLHSVPVKEFWKSVSNWRRYEQKWSGPRFWPTLYIGSNHLCGFTLFVNDRNTAFFAKSCMALVMSEGILNNDFCYSLE